MAQNKKKPKNQPGVRGPQASPSRGSSSRGTSRPSNLSSNPRRAAFERASFPYMARLTAMPRWLLIIGLGSSLLLGLVLAGSWRWLGAAFLLLVAAFLGWLLALSWPLLTGGRRLMRLLVVAALIGLAYFKVVGQF